MCNLCNLWISLSSSTDYADKDNPSYFGQRGLDPDLLPEIVAKAHGSNLRFSARYEFR